MFLVPVEGKGSAGKGMDHAHHHCNCHESSHEKSEADAKGHAENEIPRIVYYCPMHCEGDKTYDKPGTCPVCNMFLVAGLSTEIKKKSLE
jgi:Cu2+-exporting ATPase